MRQEIEQIIVDIEAEILGSIRQRETNGFGPEGGVALFAYQAEDMLAVALHGEAALIAPRRDGLKDYRERLAARCQPPTPCNSSARAPSGR